MQQVIDSYRCIYIINIVFFLTAFIR